MVYGRSNGFRASTKRITLPAELPEIFDRDRRRETGRREFMEGVRIADSPRRSGAGPLERVGELLVCTKGAV